MDVQPIFEELSPECLAAVNVTTFRYNGNRYTVSTTEIVSVHTFQRRWDLKAGYTGILGNYETMWFINGESECYPFGDLPGCAGLGVFQRYEAEEEARDGHQSFVTRVKRILIDGSEE